MNPQPLLFDLFYFRFQEENSKKHRKEKNRKYFPKTTFLLFSFHSKTLLYMNQISIEFSKNFKFCELTEFILKVALHSPETLDHQCCKTGIYMLIKIT